MQETVLVDLEGANNLQCWGFYPTQFGKLQLVYHRIILFIFSCCNYLLVIYRFRTWNGKKHTGWMVVDGCFPLIGWCEQSGAISDYILHSVIIISMAGKSSKNTEVFSHTIIDPSYPSSIKIGWKSGWKSPYQKMEVLLSGYDEQFAMEHHHAINR